MRHSRTAVVGTRACVDPLILCTTTTVTAGVELWVQAEVRPMHDPPDTQSLSLTRSVVVVLIAA